MSRARRIAPFVFVPTVLAAVFALLGPGPQEEQSGPAAVLRRFLERLGMDVSYSPELPGPPGTFVLVSDSRDPAEVERLTDWAGGGGRLVVTDPVSPTAEKLLGSPAPLEAIDAVSLTPGCVGPETAGVARLEVSRQDRALTSATSGLRECFPSGDGAYVLFFPVGEGEVIVTGGSSFMAESKLDRADNAVFVLRLLDAGGPVVFGPAVPPRRATGESEKSGIWDWLPEPAKGVVLSVILATFAFAAVRARRLGKPVLEELVSPIPSGELVSATAGLYRRARATSHCGGLMRRATAARLSRRLGIPPGMPEDVIPRAIANAGGLDPERVERAFAGREPATDDELIELGLELEAITQQVEGAKR